MDDVSGAADSLFKDMTMDVLYYMESNDPLCIHIKLPVVFPDRGTKKQNKLE